MPCHLLIRERRHELHLSQAALAKLLQPYLPYLDDSDISRIETGRRAVRADELPGFAAALRCRITDLVDEVPPAK